MTFLVRYLNSETLDIHSQLVKLIDIDAKDCSTDKLFNAFKMEIWKQQITFSYIVALSCDNVSVMTGKYLSFKKNLKKRLKIYFHGRVILIPIIVDSHVQNISGIESENE